MVDRQKLEKLGIRIKSRMNSGNYMCWCPLHKDNKPSFAIAEDTGLWICFACGRKGSWNSLVSALKGDPELLLETEDERLHRISFPKWDQLNRGAELETMWEEEYLEIFDRKIPTYLASRGISFDTAVAFGIRLDKAKGHIIFPVRDRMGTLQGVVRRQTGQRGPKYIIDNFTKSLTLFGIDKVTPGKPVLIVEGLIDAMKAYQFGYNAVALQGTSINKYQLEELTFVTDEVWVALDNDEAGLRERGNVASRATELFRSVYLILYPSSIKDIGEIREKEVLDMMVRKRQRVNPFVKIR